MRRRRRGAAPAPAPTALRLCTRHPTRRLSAPSLALGRYEGLFKPSVEVLILSSTLGRMMGGQQLVQCYTYFFVAGCWTRFVHPSFATMSAAAQRAEGQLLAGHTRLHEFAEEITMLRGGEAEAEPLVLNTAPTLAQGQRPIGLAGPF